MVRPMENTTEMQAMVNGDGDTANNESQVKGQLISKDTFYCVNSSKNEHKHLHFKSFKVSFLQMFAFIFGRIDRIESIFWN